MFGKLITKKKWCIYINSLINKIIACIEIEACCVVFYPYTVYFQNCQHNTMGEHCDVCQPGFYGYPVSGQSCRECSCPPVQGRSDLLTIGTCSLNIDGEPVCDQCPTGYTGNQCER